MTNSTQNLKARDATREMKSIDEQKKERKFMFQLISHETGKRSEPFVTTWDDLAASLVAARQDEEYTLKEIDKDYILLVAVLDGKDTIIPATPLLTIKSYLETVGKTQPEEKENV